MVHTLADPAHDSAGFHADLQPQRGAFVGRGRQQPQGRHDVAEVERRRLHVDLHHARPERSGLVRLHLQSADLPRVVQAQAVGGFVAGGDEGSMVANAFHAGHPQAALPHRDLPIAQIAAGERGQGLQVVVGTEIHETEVDSGVLAHLDHHAANRAPQPAPARVFNVEGGPPSHDGDAAPGLCMLGPVRHQCPDEGDKGRHHPLAGGVLRIATAEEVDRLHVRHPRPFVDVVDLAADERLEGNRVHLRIVEQGLPVMRRALRLAHHPAGCRNGRRIQGVRPRLRGLKQGAACGGANDGPTGTGFEHVAFGVRDQCQASGHQQAPPELPVRGGECGRIAMQKEHLHRSRAQQALIECRRLALGRVDAFESQSGVDGVKRLVVLADAIFIVADEPILALPSGTRQVPDALL